MALALAAYEAFLLERYPAPGAAATTAGPALTAKPRDQFRNYDEPARDTVREFYRLNHRHQCFDFVRAKEREFSDQMFRLKFQLASGQTDVVQKIRVLRKDIARVKTLLRENETRAGDEKKS